MINVQDKLPISNLNTNPMLSAQCFSVKAVFLDPLEPEVTIDNLTMEEAMNKFYELIAQNALVVEAFQGKNLMQDSLHPGLLNCPFKA